MRIVSQFGYDEKLLVGYLDLLKVKKQTQVSGKHYIILEALKILDNCRNY